MLGRFGFEKTVHFGIGSVHFDHLVEGPTTMVRQLFQAEILLAFVIGQSVKQACKLRGRPGGAIGITFLMRRRQRP